MGQISYLKLLSIWRFFSLKNQKVRFYVKIVKKAKFRILPSKSEISNFAGSVEKYAIVELHCLSFVLFDNKSTGNLASGLLYWKLQGFRSTTAKELLADGVLGQLNSRRCSCSQRALALTLHFAEFATLQTRLESPCKSATHDVTNCNVVKKTLGNLRFLHWFFLQIQDDFFNKEFLFLNEARNAHLRS